MTQLALTVGEYPYSALPSSTSIRLLELLPSTKGKHGSVLCSMKVVDLMKKPVYTALSYTWGAPCTVYLSNEVPSDKEATLRNCGITVDWYNINVTKNCLDLLLQLQQFKKFAKDKFYLYPPRDAEETGHASMCPTDFSFFRIDAICINQSSTSERSTQVKIMKTIYRAAQTVIIWLGHEDIFSRDAMHSLTLLANVTKEHAEAAKGLSIRDAKAYSALGISVINERRWQAILAFLYRSWFSRAWTVQEFVEARKAVMFCDDLAFGWEV